MERVSTEIVLSSTKSWEMPWRKFFKGRCCWELLAYLRACTLETTRVCTRFKQTMNVDRPSSSIAAPAGQVDS
ncbi:hypothetical protein CTS44_25284 [Comamonas thiooxydans]|nr:hypothetical protein CTS44_25284 [Comamonas thiooxydans]